MKFKIQLISQCETGEKILELACLERATEGLEATGTTLAKVLNGISGTVIPTRRFNTWIPLR